MCPPGCEVLALRNAKTPHLASGRPVAVNVTGADRQPPDMAWHQRRVKLTTLVLLSDVLRKASPPARDLPD